MQWKVRLFCSLCAAWHRVLLFTVSDQCRGKLLALLKPWYPYTVHPSSGRESPALPRGLLLGAALGSNRQGAHGRDRGWVKPEGNLKFTWSVEVTPSHLVEVTGKREFSFGPRSSCVCLEHRALVDSLRLFKSKTRGKDHPCKDRVGRWGDLSI